MLGLGDVTAVKIMYHDFILTLDKFSDFFGPSVALVFVAAAGVFLVHKLEKTRMRWPAIFFGLAFLSQLMVLGAYELIAAEARKELRAYIANNALVNVSIDGEPLSNPSSLLAALASVHPQVNQHTAPARRFTIKLTSAEGSLIVVLARDSAVPDEFWVYYPKYHTFRPDTGRIGVIQTDHL